MNIIDKELNKLSIACDNFSILQDKDGITVARIVSGEKSYVVKCFQKDEHKREMGNYRLLESIGVPTIRVIPRILHFFWRTLIVAQSTVWVSKKICPIPQLSAALQNGTNSFTAKDTVMFVRMENLCMTRQISSPSKTLPL